MWNQSFEMKETIIKKIAFSRAKCFHTSFEKSAWPGMKIATALFEEKKFYHIFLKIEEIIP
jgi:hypothetical protein